MDGRKNEWMREAKCHVVYKSNYCFFFVFYFCQLMRDTPLAVPVLLFLFCVLRPVFFCTVFVLLVNVFLQWCLYLISYVCLIIIVWI